MNEKIDYKEINRIIQLMEKKNLSHFELELEGFKINIGRNTGPLPRGGMVSFPQISQSDAGSQQKAPEEPVLEESKNNLYYIASPMVGTFYSAPDPSSSPFVEVGDKVKKNQVLCIIEAMKLMNEIESDIDGIIQEIYVENGKPIEYGQKLFGLQSS